MRNMLPVGKRYCQCPVCDRYFTGVEGFDKHRRQDKCLDPATIGYQLNEYGYWSKPKKGAAGVNSPDLPK